MTIEEAGKNYDLAMYYVYDAEIDIWGWSWAVECGYQSFDSRETFKASEDCQKSLESFLKTWTGPTK